MRRVVVKLGSSVVADGDGEPREEVLARVCDVLAGVHREGGEVIIVTSGAIARGMRVMDLPQRPSSIRELQAASAVGQGKLYRIYDELLRERDVTSAQVLLTFFDMSARTHYLNARQTLTTLLEWRVLPVINENDTTATDEISFGDNDFLAAQVAVLVAAEQLILLTDIDGLFTADPRLYPDAQDRPRGRRLRGPAGDGDRPHDLAARIGRDALEGGRRGHGHRGGHPDGDLQRPAGGRRSRRCSRASARARAFAAREARYSSFKLWLKYAKPSRGTLLIDAGAARAVREGSASLLPVGVVEVLGDFDAGDAVDIAEAGAGRGEQGNTLGKGICNYSAQELRQVQGMKSAAAARDPAARQRGGGAPRLPRGGLTVVRCRAMATVNSLADRQSVQDICRSAKRAARTLARLDTAVKDAALEAIAAALESRTEEILAANERDMQAGREADIGDGAARPPAPGRAARRRRSRGRSGRSRRWPTRWAR